MREDVRKISADYAGALANMGPTLEGVGWPNAADLVVRYATLLGPIDFDRFSRNRPLRLIDLGCGLGFLLDYFAKNDLLDRVDYTGVDVSEVALTHACRRWPLRRFDLRDIRDRPFQIDEYDYCIICGVFTSRCCIGFEEMRKLVEATLTAVWRSVAIGVGFNVMSKHVDWEREDLFHWPLDDMMAFCKAKLSRHVSFRLDNGLWDVSAFVLRDPVQLRTAIPETWVNADRPAAALQGDTKGVTTLGDANSLAATMPSPDRHMHILRASQTRPRQ